MKFLCPTPACIPELIEVTPRFSVRVLLDTPQPIDDPPTNIILFSPLVSFAFLANFSKPNR